MLLFRLQNSLMISIFTFIQTWLLKASRASEMEAVLAKVQNILTIAMSIYRFFRVPITLKISCLTLEPHQATDGLNSLCYGGFVGLHLAVFD